MRTTEIIVIGAGQAGLALSRFLTRAGHEHVVLERGRVGERWRSERWDSLSLLTPNWLNELPGPMRHADPDGFLSRDGFVGYLEEYAQSFSAPVHEGVSVLEVARTQAGFSVETDSGVWAARSVVIATGYADEPRLPAIAAAAPGTVLSIHSSGYRSPAQLPPGGVLVVGAGPSGQQIAAELAEAGREVAIAVGRHAPMRRRYRGRDIWSWLDASGNLDQTLDDVPHERKTSRALSVVLSGADGGRQLDLGALSALGVTVSGRLRGFSGRHAIFADDLERTVERAEQRQRRVFGRIDDYIETLPPAERPETEAIPEPALPPASRVLDLDRVSTVIWATGYGRSYPWLNADVLGDDGEIAHRRGITRVPGLYALGLRFQHRRKSHFIGGVGGDARFIASRILSRSATGALRPEARRHLAVGAYVADVA